MQLASEFVGRRSAPLRVEVDVRQSMNYAASVGDDNPAYFDDRRPGGVIAPPMFAVALTWKISSQFEAFWEETPFPVECLRRQVHLTESIVWHRPLRPGDVLCIEGECKAILPQKSGTLVLLEYRAIDGGGELVFLERIGGLLRDVRCLDAGRGHEFAPRQDTMQDAGAPLWEKRVHVDRLAAHHYDGCADIHFPIHTSVAYAQEAGLPDIIYQGTATLSHAMHELTNAEANGDPGLLREVQCGFGAMVIPGTDIVIQLLGRERGKDETRLHFQVLNVEGKQAIRQGTLTIGSSSAWDQG